MSGQSFFQGLLSSVFERGISFSRQSDNRPILELAEALVSERGEVSGTKIAHALLTKYQTLSTEERETFLLEINDAFDVDATDVMHAAENYARDQSAPNLKRLQEVAEPRRLELLRRLNAAPGGTQSLVRMREDILALVRKHNQLKRTDVDFEHLFSSWFNRGFLVMRPIDWQTPAHILEKIITYEAVHAIDSWDDLRRRLLPEDRRCFAFFHPAMPDEPLIFVEVALTNKIENSIQEVLAEERTIIADTEATTAVFYSISNCQQGLKGVSFGNMLIKQVADDLSHSLPNLKTFVTLSPVPGFMSWLHEEADRDPESKAKEALDYIRGAARAGDVYEDPDMQQTLTGLAARYFLIEKRSDRQPVDPVSRFHLGNGASIRQINWAGDVSEKGYTQSAGIMVNYLYDLNEVEENHEAYAKNRDIKAHKAIRTMAEKNRPQKQENAPDQATKQAPNNPDAATANQPINGNDGEKASQALEDL